MAVNHTVELHIGRLVLRGVADSDSHVVAAAVESELGRLLAQDLPRKLLADHSTESIPAQPVASAIRDRPRSLGRGVARSVYQALRGGE